MEYNGIKIDTNTPTIEDYQINSDDLPGGRQNFIKEDKTVNNTGYRLVTTGISGHMIKKDNGKDFWALMASGGGKNKKKRKTFRRKSLKKRKTFKRK
jgi:hypothetical protein